MRAFIYCRFSSHKQQELSIEGQRDICQEYADKHNITVVGQYADRARSGKTENRADFRRLMRDAATGVVDCVLVWRYDRFFRNRAESALYRKQLEAAGVHLISVTEYIPEGSAGIITQGMIETVAEYFSAKLSEDVSRGMNRAAQHCQIVGRAPLGYRAGPNKRWQIDPVGAELVRRIFEWYASGKAMGQLAAQLNEEGHRTTNGTLYTRSSFNSILRNEKYIGVYSYGGEVRIEGGCPRIIEDELFFTVQRRLSANRHRPGAYKAEVPYLLSGKLFCGLCGAPMTGTAGTSHTGARHYYYICNNRRAKTCKKKNVRLDLIEEAVLQSALDILTDENIAYISTEVERRCAENSDSAALLASLNAQLEEVQRRLKNIGNAIAQGIITETTKELLEEAEADRTALRQQIDRAKVQAALVVKAEAVACWLDGFRRGDRTDPDFRRQVFGALVHSVFVYDDYLKIIFNVDSAGAAVVPYEAAQAATPSEAPPGSYLDTLGAPKKALRKRKAFFIMIAALCECFHLPLTSTQVSGSFCFAGEKFIHPPGDATTAANGSGGSFLLPCTAAICYTKEKTEGEALRMTRIAIVEDEAAVREQLAGYVQRYTRQYGTQFEVTMFTDGVEILEDYRPVYDIIFLDVEMQHLDGMETARRIRELDSDVLLIFITNMAQYAIKGYAVGALDYVLKPVPYFAFSQQLQKAVNQLAKRTRHYLAVPVDGGMRRLDAATIYYIESEGHRVHFYTEDGDFSAPGALKALEEKLTSRLFARCNSGYLVNLAQVSGVQQNTVQVGPHELQISRPKRRAFLAALADYIGGEGA